MRNTFEFNGRAFNRQDNGYCFVTENGKKTRISGAKFNDAYDEFLAWQMEQTATEIETEQVEETQVELIEEPKKTTKRAKKVNKNLTNITLGDGTQIGLTEKQLLFIERMPEDNFWENGLDSALWVDCYCDTISDELNAMQVGAMVSTLREKGLLVVAGEKRNGKKAKSFHLTDLGQKLAIALGLK